MKYVYMPLKASLWSSECFLLGLSRSWRKTPLGPAGVSWESAGWASGCVNRKSSGSADAVFRQPWAC